MKKITAVDKILGSLFLALLLIGFAFFLSASFGVLASNPIKFVSMIKSQFLLGLVGGIICIFLVMRIPTDFWQKYSPWFFGLSLLLTLLVFVPALSYEHGGANRWISLGFVSFQPVELLKAASILYLSVIYKKFLKKDPKDIKNNSYSFFALVAPAAIIMVLVTSVLIFQPDTKNTVILFLITFIILFVVGLPFRYIGFMAGVVVFLGLVLIQTRPYVKDRFVTFLNPEHDVRGSSYQLSQSLIALGSGKILGQGFGQSVQKFNFLPEPQGDSIFAVVGEEVGFVGSTLVLLLYLGFILRGIKLSLGITNGFGRLFMISFFSLFGIQTFLNVASIIGLIPLTGVPLPLMSQGGTSLLVTCGLFGIILRILYEEKQKNL